MAPGWGVRYERPGFSDLLHWVSPRASIKRSRGSRVFLVEARMKKTALLCSVLWFSVGMGQAQDVTGEPGAHPAIGPESALVTIVEFADFQCGQCRDMYATLKTVLENYPMQVRLVFRQLPLATVHPLARQAAQASLCAFEQNGFWEYHDALFGNAEDLESETLRKWAGLIGLDLERFDACLRGGEKAEAVREDIQAAIDAGAYSVPTLYINGQMMTGNWAYRDVARVIDNELFRLLGEEIQGTRPKGADDGDPGQLLHDRSVFQNP